MNFSKELNISYKVKQAILENGGKRKVSLKFNFIECIIVYNWVAIVEAVLDNWALKLKII